MNADAIGLKTTKPSNNAANNGLLVFVLAIAVFALYELCDSKQLYAATDKTNYEIPFSELQAINPEVVAWLEVYGTNIDYPVTQASDNARYVTGAIILDAANSKDFGDFNSLVYGHHMEKDVLCGEIGRFSERVWFEEYKYGNLHCRGEDYGIEIFAFLRADAYDKTVFTPNVGESDRGRYLEEFLERALYKRDVGVTDTDRLVLLVTCSSDSTNGRDILAGKITGKSFTDPFMAPGPAGYVQETFLWPLLALVIISRLTWFFVAGRRHRFRVADCKTLHRNFEEQIDLKVHFEDNRAHNWHAEELKAHKRHFDELKNLHRHCEERRARKRRLNERTKGDVPYVLQRPHFLHEGDEAIHTKAGNHVIGGLRRSACSASTKNTRETH